MGGQPIDEAETEIADQPQGCDVVGEQSIQSVGHGRHAQRVETAPALIFAQYVGGAGIATSPEGQSHHLGQRRRVLEAEIQALAGDRMDRVRRISNQGQSIGSEATSQRQAERESLPTADHAQLAETVAETAQELCVEQEGRAGNEALGDVGPLAPDER